MHAVGLNGTLLSATPVVVGIGNAECPLSITLKSADAGRKIELSTDGGTEYFNPAVSVTSATMLILYVNNPITHVRFTGVATNKYLIL